MQLKELVKNNFDLNCWLAIHTLLHEENNCIWNGYGDEEIPSDILNRSVCYITTGTLPHSNCPAIIIEVE